MIEFVDETTMTPTLGDEYVESQFRSWLARRARIRALYFVPRLYQLASQELGDVPEGVALSDLDLSIWAG